MSSILVYVDHFGGKAKPVSSEIMGKAGELAGKLGVPVIAFVAGQNVGGVASEAIACGADKVLVADGPAFAQFNAQAFAAALKAAIAAAQPRIILVPATAGARDVAALVACELRIGLAAECQGLDLDAAGNLLADRPVFSGNIIHHRRLQQPRTNGDRARPQLPAASGRCRSGRRDHAPRGERAARHRRGVEL